MFIFIEFVIQDEAQKQHTPYWLTAVRGCSRKKLYFLFEYVDSRMQPHTEANLYVACCYIVFRLYIFRVVGLSWRENIIFSFFCFTHAYWLYFSKKPSCWYLLQLLHTCPIKFHGHNPFTLLEDFYSATSTGVELAEDHSLLLLQSVLLWSISVEYINYSAVEQMSHCDTHTHTTSDRLLCCIINTKPPTTT